MTNEEKQEKLREYRRKWYAKNRERAKKSVMSRRKSIRADINEMKSQLKCERCPENHIGCLEFHHLDRNGKDSEVAVMVARGMSLDRIKSEMSKCIVLCSNCHRKLHWEERGLPTAKSQLAH